MLKCLHIHALCEVKSEAFTKGKEKPIKSTNISSFFSCEINVQSESMNIHKCVCLHLCVEEEKHCACDLQK